MINWTEVGLTYFGLPVVMFLLGAIMSIYPPKKKNRWYGYRTIFAMRSEESFQFAQEFITPPMLHTGLVSLLMSLVLIVYMDMYNPAHLEAVGWMLCVLYTAFFLALIVTTELVLYSKFIKKSRSS